MTTTENATLMTVQGLAALLQVPVATVYRWRHLGTGPPGVRVGRYVRYRSCDVDEWLAGRRDVRPGAA